ncbi:MAG: papain-like cysteine protease family protein [Acidobacteriota bacterium]
MPSIQIHGVQHQRQLTKRACWYTGLQMVVRYVESTSFSCNSDLTSPEYFPKMQSRFEAKSNPSWAEWRAWAKQCGFKPLDLTPNAMGVYQFLSQYGPIIYSGTWGNSFDGHVVVLTGINTDTGVLTIDDPWEANSPQIKDIDTYFSELMQTLWENPLFVY